MNSKGTVCITDDDVLEELKLKELEKAEAETEKEAKKLERVQNKKEREQKQQEKEQRKREWTNSCRRGKRERKSSQ